jgi:Icc-related predicted phosphoesterase
MLRVFTTSDIHIDFEENYKWFNSISDYDYKDDILILAGDIIDKISKINSAFKILKSKFSRVSYVPGNHDLWVHSDGIKDSIDKFNIIKKSANENGIDMEPVNIGTLSIVPLLGWYDYTFGSPVDDLLKSWSDYVACKWPENYNETDITLYFISLNESFLNIKNNFIISFSHFLPRIDIMPSFIPPKKRILYPVFGTTLLEKQIRKLKSNIHIYGHSHLNMQINLDNTIYINNAYGYPYEKKISSKRLKCIYETK